MRWSSFHKAGIAPSAAVGRSPSVKVRDLLIINNTRPNRPNPAVGKPSITDATTPSSTSEQKPTPKLAELRPLQVVITFPTLPAPDKPIGVHPIEGNSYRKETIPMFGVRRVASAVGAVTFGLLLAVSLTTPAQAHTSTARHGQDFATVGPGHNHITWCDQEADGHRVLAYYLTRNGLHHFTEWDGGDPGCGQKTTQSEIVQFAVCEEGEGCGRIELA